MTLILTHSYFDHFASFYLWICVFEVGEYAHYPSMYCMHHIIYGCHITITLCMGMWDAETGALLSENHTDDVFHTAFSRDGQYIVEASGSTIQIRDANTRAIVSGPFRGHTDLFCPSL
jgi:WD40 repeat protein